MRLIVVSRIDSDKDFFYIYLDVVSKLKKIDNIEIKILFVGSIDSITVYDGINHKAQELDIYSQIDFTKKSISYIELPNEEEDYYLNISIGDFIGYSSIEGLSNKFKSIFINADLSIHEMNNRMSFCNNRNEFYELIKGLNFNNKLKHKLIEDNYEILKLYTLSYKEQNLLEKILIG